MFNVYLQAGSEMAKFPNRDKYAVKDIMRDIKKIEPSPSILYDFGSKLVYTQWTTCQSSLGADHPVTTNFYDLMEFMQREYEGQLVGGELWRVADTPTAAINHFLKNRPDEFLSYVFDRSPDYIRTLLEEADKARKAEIKEYKRFVKFVKREVKASPDDPNLHNKLRLLLWLAGKYSEASASFKKAKKLGWIQDESRLVSL